MDFLMLILTASGSFGALFLIAKFIAYLASILTRNPFRRRRQSYGDMLDHSPYYHTGNIKEFWPFIITSLSTESHFHHMQ